MMMQVVDGNGNPTTGTVSLYKSEGNFYEPYRTAQAPSSWTWTAPNANIACDIGDNNTINPSWAPIDPGVYILRCDNYYTTLSIPPASPGADFNIKYQNGNFTIIFDDRGITLGTSLSWDKIMITINQYLSNGTTQVGTVAMGYGTLLSNRYNSPAYFYADNNNTYMFDAYKDIYSSQKYYQWNTEQDVTDFHLFLVLPNSNIFTSHLLPTSSGVTVQNSLLDDPALSLANNTSVGFSDPWLTDYSDPNYGNVKQNQGMCQLH
jgi:hypothetical protein